MYPVIMLPPLLTGVSQVSVTPEPLWSVKFRFRGGLGLSVMTTNPSVLTVTTGLQRFSRFPLTNGIHDLYRVGGSAGPADAGFVLSSDSKDVLLVLHHVVEVC